MKRVQISNWCRQTPCFCAHRNRSHVGISLVLQNKELLISYISRQNMNKSFRRSGLNIWSQANFVFGRDFFLSASGFTACAWNTADASSFLNSFHVKGINACDCNSEYCYGEALRHAHSSQISRIVRETHNLFPLLLWVSARNWSSASYLEQWELIKILKHIPVSTPTSHHEFLLMICCFRFPLGLHQVQPISFEAFLLCIFT